MECGDEGWVGTIIVMVVEMEMAVMEAFGCCNDACTAEEKNVRQRFRFSLRKSLGRNTSKVILPKCHRCVSIFLALLPVHDNPTIKPLPLPFSLLEYHTIAGWLPSGTLSMVHGA